jgi:hypothetical protein
LVLNQLFHTPLAPEVVAYGFLHIGWKVYFSFSKAGLIFFKGFDVSRRGNKYPDIFFQTFFYFSPEVVLFEQQVLNALKNPQVNGPAYKSVKDESLELTVL